MTLSDVSIIGKKILVGIVITLVPFIIIVGGLWITRKALSGNEKPRQQILKTTKSNKL